MTKRAILQLDGLTCPSCMTKIQKGLENQDGVEKVQVLFNASKAKADFDDSVVSAEELGKVVDKLGYEVKKIKVKDQVASK
ncbi:heavy-metal-associated domain-containing protein [Secundilactobacillus folii]|uniref:Copper chaperone CopZ n=1 Tax=Secundilactobacillus folii TaxID=2678357 RepID=A0A7X3C2L6_9LACO|nr:heavy-metal-associated domain-containing protein [Secundilactobacillus folii]MTV81587.1 heavy metal-binding protein [Secundilactobacillus folii]